jgi:predicted nucleic acid-binding protein
MRLVDTSTWIEWLTGSPLSQTIEAELPMRSEWLVPTVVQLELAKWLRREVGENEANRTIAFTTTCSVIDLNTAIALSAVEVGAQHRLAMADAIIYATALAHDADVLTCDRHFENLLNIRYLPKPT